MLTTQLILRTYTTLRPANMWRKLGNSLRVTNHYPSRGLPHLLQLLPAQLHSQRRLPPCLRVVPVRILQTGAVLLLVMAKNPPVSTRTFRGGQEPLTA